MQSPTYVSYTTFFTIVHVGNDGFALSDKVVIRNVIGQQTHVYKIQKGLRVNV